MKWTSLRGSGKVARSVLICALWSLCSSLQAAVITAASGSQADIQAAINSALSGDVVVIPSGNHGLAGTIMLKEGIHVRGMGIGQTTLTKTSENNNPIFLMYATNGIPFQITDMTLHGIGFDLLLEDPDSDICEAGIQIQGLMRDFQISDCRFEHFGGYGILLMGGSYTPTGQKGHPVGVIHDCEFEEIFWSNGPESRGYGVVVYANEDWPTKLQLGQSEAVFIENNYFNRTRHAVCANTGARYVFRYNVVDDNFRPYAAIDAHGNQSWSLTGTRSYEIYENAVSGGVTWPEEQQLGTWMYGLRGGDGVLYSNDFSGPYTGFLVVEAGNTNNVYTYPVKCQTTNLWVWGNFRNGISDNWVNIGYDDASRAYNAQFFQLGRDYFTNNVAKAGYAAYFYPHPRVALVGHWTFDETTGTIAADKSAAGHNVTATTPYAALVDGYCYKARKFNTNSANAGYYHTPQYTPALNSTSFTVSAWINLEGTNTPRTVIRSRDNSPNNKGWDIRVNTDNGWLVMTGTGTGFDTLYGPKQATGVWTHVVTTFNGGTKKKELWLDGVLSTSNTVSAFVTNSTQLAYIGGTPGYGQFQGAIDDVRVYNRVLSGAEIQALYNRLSDPSFETTALNAGPWEIYSGTPTLTTTYKKLGAKSVYFNKPLTNTTSQQIRMANSLYIPVKAGAQYKIGCWAKGTGIVQGTQGHYKLYLAGQWFDKNMTLVSGYFPDLGMDTGTYDWKWFSNTLTAPTGACYYRVYWMGIPGDAKGQGWVDGVEFRPVVE